MAEQSSTFQQTYTPGSDISIGYETGQLIWGRTGNDFVLGYHKVNPGLLPSQVDYLLGDVAIDDFRGRQWRDTFALGDWQKPYYANPGFSIYGLNEYAVITDFNPQIDRVQLFGNANNYRVLNVGTGTLLLLQKPTGLDVIALFLGTPSLDLNAPYMEYKSNIAAPTVNPNIKQRNFATAGFDIAFATTTDPSGNVYQAGGTHGAIAGAVNNNESRDSVIIKYDSQGNVLWSKQFGSNRFDTIYGMKTDADGNLYVSGTTFGNLYGTKSGDVGDVILAKFDSSGREVWTRQFGSPKGAAFVNSSFSLDVDTSGNVFVSGISARFNGLDPLPRDDFWVTKYDTNGNRQWFTEFGTSDYDEPYAVTVSNDGSIYAAGWTFANFAAPNQGAYDTAIAKLNPDGSVAWQRQLGSNDYEWIWGADTDSKGNLYVSGYTLGSLPGNTNAGSYDAFLAKYDKDGNRIWVKQFGTAGDDQAFKLAIDNNDRIFITGYTDRNLGGTNAGNYDAWVARYDTDGNRQWINQFGTSETEQGYGISTDNSGNVYVTGMTQGSLGAANAGSFDAWIAKYNEAGTLLDFEPTNPTAPTPSTFAVGNTNGNPTVTDQLASIILRALFGSFLVQQNLPAGSGGSTGANIDDLLRFPLFAPGIPAGAISTSSSSPMTFNVLGNLTGITTPQQSTLRRNIQTLPAQTLSDANNSFQGSEANETVNGQGGKDKLAGMGGQDLLTGGSENDRLVGGKGDDLLTGGKGADLFVLSNKGTDKIVDFNAAAGDRLLLTGRFDQFQVVQGTGLNDKDTLIQKGDDVLAILMGTQASQLSLGAIATFR